MGRRPAPDDDQDGGAMTTVAVTGATGIFGKALCALLQADDTVERIIGVARSPFDPGRHGWTKMVFRSADVQDPDALDDAFAGADVVCHLAFAVLSKGAAEERIRRVNVDGSRNVFDAAARAGVHRIVYASSVAAYGAHADNPVPIRESHPTRGNEGFYYSEHKAQVEEILDEFEAANPGVEVARIRPCVVVGPNSVDLFRGPLPVPVAGLLLSPLVPWPLPDPGAAPFQLVHEDDVAEVFRLAITAPSVSGAYNLAGGGTIRFDDLARALGSIRVPVPAGILKRMVDAAHRIRVSPADGGWVDIVQHPIILDTTRTREGLGWVPAYDTRTALDAQLDCFRGRVAG
jgi:nucleoside-diphosphate-sugar epimerase